MTIVPSTYFLFPEPLAVPLERYAQLTGCPEQAFFGIDWTGNVNYHCPAIWTKDQRLLIGHALLEAQLDMEEVMGFDLMPRYHEDERHPFTAESIRTNRAFLIDFGTKHVDDISLGETLDHTNDPAEASVAGMGTITNVSEIHLYHPGTDFEILPSEMTIVSGTLSIKIPRSRLLVDDNNPVAGWDYGDLGNFETEIDVKREYTDSTYAATIVSVDPDECGSGCGTEVLNSTCVIVQSAPFGLVRVKPLYHSLNDVFVDLNYRAGMTIISEKVERAIVRYAHSKMTAEPVDNDYHKTLWLADRDSPSSMTQEQQDCPWGLSIGAFQAWKLARTMKKHRAGSV